MSRYIIHYLKRIDQLIHLKATGSPFDLASKLEISERCLYNYIKLMKDHGAPIKFCKQRRSYYYVERGRFQLKFLKEGM
ncbi:HTH domain-containing protein [Mucilaginibacter pineti]|uniref:HTH domain-containing protein n=1 Tax=Mucilaginibacter pineti TaxID=1391627 RepID=A0A1G7MLK0_9SPHI|nr:HTH domain-containing protein [Mucilaginibacter pineti]SDF62621.1 HTH domain-containing protein [Mucilaginibacter pineti]